VIQTGGVERYGVVRFCNDAQTGSSLRRIRMRKLFGAMVALALVAPAFTAPAMAGGMQPAAAAGTQTQTIVAIAASNPDFSTLVTALKAAELTDALSGAGPFTVFAPTNAAFAALPAGTVETLLKPENKAKLQAVLKFHVLGAAVESSALAGKKLTSPPTLQGGTLEIDGKHGVKVAGANVVKADIRGSNGIIHVIDKVLLPAK
jgi:uncharacterized surface protein with fasciclin (FAS1) repeats